MIYETKKWRANLQGIAFGHTAESLLKRWIKSGAGALAEIDGSWSLILEDRGNKCTTGVTDCLATKPLYIHTETKQIKSRIRELLFKSGQIELDELYFSSVAKWGYHIGDRTFAKHVRKLPPATYTMVDMTKAFDQYEYTVLVPNEVDIRGALEKAVDDYLVTDKPIAVMASGGLDSAILLGLILKRTHDITVFHIDNNEEEYFNCLGIPGDVNVQKLELEEFDLNEILYHNESPVDLGSLVPQYQLAAAVKKAGFDIVITGDGGDELFGGYHRTARYDSQWSDIFEELVYYHLPRLDKEMSAHGVELRCPFLSRPVIEGALNLPYSQRIGKNHLKELFSDIVPKRIIERKKQALKRPIAEKEEYRLELIKKFREEVVYEYGRC